RLCRLQVGPELRAGGKRPWSLHHPAGHPRAPRHRRRLLLRQAYRRGRSQLTDGGDDLRVKPGIFLEFRGPFLLEALHPLLVLVGPPRPLIQAAGLEYLDVVDARDTFRDFVTEVGVIRPGDGAFGDRFDDCTRVLDGDLLAARGPFATADAPGVHEIDLERTRAVQLEEAIALLFVPKREERVGPGDPQRFAHLVLATGRRALGFAEHEVGGGMRGIEPGNPGDDVVIAVEDQQDVGRPDIARIFEPAQGGQLEGGSAILRVAG